MKFIFDLLWKKRGSSVSYVAFFREPSAKCVEKLALGLLRLLDMNIFQILNLTYLVTHI